MASLIGGIVQLELCGHTRIAVVGVNVWTRFGKYGLHG